MCDDYAILPWIFCTRNKSLCLFHKWTSSCGRLEKKSFSHLDWQIWFNEQNAFCGSFQTDRLRKQKLDFLNSWTQWYKNRTCMSVWSWKKGRFFCVAKKTKKEPSWLILWDRISRLQWKSVFFPPPVRDCVPHSCNFMVLYSSPNNLINGIKWGHHVPADGQPVAPGKVWLNRIHHFGKGQRKRRSRGVAKRLFVYARTDHKLVPCERVHRFLPKWPGLINAWPKDFIQLTGTLGHFIALLRLHFRRPLIGRHYGRLIDHKSCPYVMQER